MIDADVPPAAGLLVDDFDLCRLAKELFDVPGDRKHLIVVATGGGPRDLAVDEQVDAGLPFVRSAAHQHVDQLSRDLKRWRCEPARVRSPRPPSRF